MDELLSKETLIELDKAQRKLRVNQLVKIKSNSRWLKKTLAWCHEHEITLGRSDNQYCYITHEGIAAIEQRFYQLGYEPINKQLNAFGGDRIALAKAKMSVNEKQAKQLPTEHLVLTANLDLNMRLTYQTLYSLLDTPPQINIELDVHHLDLKCFDYLIVVENRDCFNAWHEYQTELSVARSLVVYRGHEKTHSKACQTLKARWLAEKGTVGQIYFGDFDMAGLAIPIDSKTAYQYFLFPELDALRTLLITEHYDYDEAHRLRKLPLRCPEQWQPLLSLLLEKEQGLRQQWMFDKRLVLY